MHAFLLSLRTPRCLLTLVLSPPRLSSSGPNSLPSATESASLVPSWKAAQNPQSSSRLLIRMLFYLLLPVPQTCPFRTRPAPALVWWYVLNLVILPRSLRYSKAGPPVCPSQPPFNAHAQRSEYQFYDSNTFFWFQLLPSHRLWLAPIHSLLHHGSWSSLQSFWHCVSDPSAWAFFWYRSRSRLRLR